LVVDKAYELPIANAVVELFGSDGSILKYITDSTGMYFFEKEVKADTKYKISCSLKGFLTQFNEFTIDSVNRSFLLDFYFPIVPATKLCGGWSHETPTFDYNSCRLNKNFTLLLDDFAQVMKENPNLVVEFSGYMDVNEKNKNLSLKRAKAVCNYLKKKGIDSERLRSNGFTVFVPLKIETNDSVFSKGTILTTEYMNALSSIEKKEIAHCYNRRIEFRIVGTNYKIKP
jgi:hypothetical protein